LLKNCLGFLRIFKFCLVLGFMLTCKSVSALGTSSSLALDYISVVSTKENLFSEQEFSRPNPILAAFKLRQNKSKRVAAALLAFPFPFGMVGLHRIYLGTAPHVPVVYIGTLGGVFGILPFIDFCVLVLDKDIERYSENKKIFMWVN
jgi:TM2 domain-containing membrane protein YozV